MGKAALAVVLFFSLNVAYCHELFVRRVAGCTHPITVFHGHAALSPLRCENRLIGGNALDQARFYDLRQFDPECETVPVAEGAGMHGVAPALCVALTGGTSTTFPVKLPDHVLRPVALLRDKRGFEMGTGVLIAPNVILTAQHVVIPSKSAHQQPTAAVFDYAQSESCELASLAEEVSFKLPYDTSGSTLQLLASSKKLDYALLTIEPQSSVSSETAEISPVQVVRARRQADGCSLLTLNPKNGLLPADFGISPIPIDDAAIKTLTPPRDVVTVVGFTRNVFFPRGLLAATGRVTEANVLVPPLDVAPTSIHYNAQTTHGFSGGPVFDGQFKWIGVHTTGYSTLDEPEAVRHGAFKFFQYPNGGHRLERILSDLAACIKLELPPKWLKDTILLRRIAAMPVAEPCSWSGK